MRVNIYQNSICSIDFDTVDQVIDFIKKFNNQETPNTITGSNIWPGPYETKPQKPWYDWTHDVKIGDTIPDPHTIYSNITTSTISYDLNTK